MTDTPVTKVPSKVKIAANLSTFLRTHYLNASEHPELEKTNTRIADKANKISGGTYHIPDDEYDDFLKIYYHETVKKNKKEYLTEKQLASGGGILIDVDLRYDATVHTRQHTKDHVIDLLGLYLEEIKQIYQCDENTRFMIYVFEKPNVNRIAAEDAEKCLTKDGLHIIIGIQADATVQTILRKRVIDRIGDVWTDIPIKANYTWEDVFDEGISKGVINWQLYGSCKPGNETYQLKYIFNVTVDTVDGEFVMPELDVRQFMQSEENFLQLSARYRKHACLFMKNTFMTEYQQKKSGSSSSSSSNLINMQMMGLLPPTREPGSMFISNINDILKIRTADDLDQALAYFLDSLQPVDHELREAYEYAMALPKSYYGPGSFVKWIRVGWALKNTSKHLFIVWVKFSSQSDTFSYTCIPELWEKWESFDKNAMGGLTKRSIMYWVQQECPEKHKQVIEDSVEFYIDQTLDSITASINSSERRAAKGSGDYDIATVLHKLFAYQYACVSIKANMWYRFQNHRWEEIDSGTTLRKAISNELRDVYIKKQGKLLRQKLLLKNQGESDENTNKLKALQMRIETVMDIIQRLSRTNDKKNIMTEAKELFFDANFLQKLDNDPYLICFKNGVVDFRQKTFRKGQPEDYVSKCTNIDYVKIDPVRHAKLVGEIEDFMHKLFPYPDIHEYMWDHLASTLIGNNMNQTFNMYIGIGQNGKSVLVNLMEQVLGDYKGDVPLSLLTQQRTKIGGVSPELAQLKGVRYAVMQEPSKGDRINEGIMKQITGGDPVQARAPYMPQVLTFIPQFKLVVCSNEYMEIRSQDHGTRRRIRVVDFVSLFTENPVDGDPDKPFQYKLDKTIKEKFETWREIFASMLVDRSYRNNGNVQDCQRVMASSNSYLDRQDFISEFIHERIEVYENGCIQKQQLALEFKEWFMVNMGGKPPNTRDVADVMDKRFGKIQCGVWRGVKFKARASMVGSTLSDSGSIQSHLPQDGETELVEIDEL